MSEDTVFAAFGEHAALHVAGVFGHSVVSEVEKGSGCHSLLTIRTIAVGIPAQVVGASAGLLASSRSSLRCGQDISGMVAYHCLAYTVLASAADLASAQVRRGVGRRQALRCECKSGKGDGRRESHCDRWKSLLRDGTLFQIVLMARGVGPFIFNLDHTTVGHSSSMKRCDASNRPARNNFHLSPHACTAL